MIKKSNKKITVALTGATGFLGRYILEELVSAGFRVKALARKQAVRESDVEWVIGDLNNSNALRHLCKNADFVIHAAGLVKALNRNIFFDVNETGTLNILQASKVAKTKGFLHVSSLVAREQHLSHYAASKRAAEIKVETHDWPFKWMIYRPGGIYGPRDMEILKIFKTVRKGFLPGAGSKNNRFSMIHAKDMARALIAQLSEPFTNEIIEISDGHKDGYCMNDVAETMSDILDIPRPRVYYLPKFLLWPVGFINSLYARFTDQPAILTQQKASELCHRDWVTDPDKAISNDIWVPDYDLKSGLDETIRWYNLKNYI